MHPSLAHTAHRPWPLPDQVYQWRQSWLDLLFAHWRIAADVLQPLVPPPLKVQEFDGSSWIGVVPFRMDDVMLRQLPGLPWISSFPELNVRIYVEHDGRPGVWFFSLDAANSLAVWAARRFFHLPYFWAEMSMAKTDDVVTYASERKRGPSPATFRAQYGPVSAPYLARAGSLEHWLTERYCLYARAADGRWFTADIHHVPWPLQRAEADISANRLLEPHGLNVAGAPELLHFARRLDVAVWNLRKIEPG